MKHSYRSKRLQIFAFYSFNATTQVSRSHQVFACLHKPALLFLGRGEASSTFQGLATQSADITADDTDGPADMNNSFGAFDDFDDGAAGLTT